MTTYRYMLEPYKIGGSTKYQCPSCGRKRCFTRYIDMQTKQYVDASVGKCDHQHSCGYHYRPSEFFRDNASLDRSTYQSNLSAIQTDVNQKPKVQTEFIPPQLVECCRYEDACFLQWLRKIAPSEEAYKGAVSKYTLGELRLYTGEEAQNNPVIFWYIDRQHRVHDGKIMYYLPNGHRDKERNPNFVGTKYAGTHGITADFKQQRNLCLFGEHQLTDYPSLPVNLVESEKTAIVCSMFHPEALWLASGGCNYLKAEKLEPLTGRRVYVFPDSGCYDKWAKILKSSPLHNYTITKKLEQYPANTDIADLLLSELHIEPS